MKIIPLKPLPSQTFTVILGGQYTQLNIYQTAYGLYLDLYVSNTQILAGAICQNLNLIVRSLYLGFAGDLTFIDNQGSEDPVYTGLGSRFSLAYLEVSDLAAGQG